MGYDAALKCVGGNVREKPAKARECAKSLEGKVAAIRARSPAADQLSGCARTVADSVRGALADLEERTKGGSDWDLGVEFKKMHDDYRSCAGRLFRCGSLKTLPDPCESKDLEGQLGLRDDEHPGPDTYRKRRMGKLSLADGRELDPETLRPLGN